MAAVQAKLAAARAESDSKDADLHQLRRQLTELVRVLRGRHAQPSWAAHLVVLDPCVIALALCRRDRRLTERRLMRGWASALRQRCLRWRPCKRSQKAQKRLQLRSPPLYRCLMCRSESRFTRFATVIHADDLLNCSLYWSGVPRWQGCRRCHCLEQKVLTTASWHRHRCWRCMMSVMSWCAAAASMHSRSRPSRPPSAPRRAIITRTTLGPVTLSLWSHNNVKDPIEQALSTVWRAGLPATSVGSCKFHILCRACCQHSGSF